MSLLPVGGGGLGGQGASSGCCPTRATHPRSPQAPCITLPGLTNTLSGAWAQVSCAPSPALPGSPPTSVSGYTRCSGQETSARSPHGLGVHPAPASSSSPSWPEAPIAGGRSSPAAHPMTHVRAEGGAASELLKDAPRPAPAPGPAPGHTRCCSVAVGTPRDTRVALLPPGSPTHVHSGLGQGRTGWEYQQEWSSRLHSAERAPPAPAGHAPGTAQAPWVLRVS